MQKILITGASGLLGSNLAYLASNEYETLASYNSHPVNIVGCECFKMDITKRDQVLKYIDDIRPDLIVHCAANTNVDYCETNQSEVWIQNVEGTENIAIAAEKYGCFLIHISTDSIFNGLSGNYDENDNPSPINYYSFSKLEAERAILKYNLEYLIIRTNIYGINILDKFSFAEWIIDSLKSNRKISLFNDVYFSPILVNNLIDIIFDLYEKRVCGIYNVSGKDSCTKLKFGETVSSVFHLNENYIESISLSEKNLLAQRPKNTSLNISKVSNASNIDPLSLKEGLHRMKQLIDMGYDNLLKSNLR